MNKLCKALSLSLGLVCVSFAAHAADWSDNAVSYRYGADFSEPGNAKDVRKNILGFTHVSGYKYGSNFLNVDVLMSDKADPARNSTSGAQEIYIVYANQLHLGKITGKKFEYGLIKDYAWTNGFDFNSKDTAFAPRVRKFMTGPTVKFGGSLGWADLSLLYYKEKNHNGIVGKSVDFDSTFRIATAWGLTFNAGPVPLKFNGFANYTGAKGKDGFGTETDPETWADAFLMVDVGKLVTGQKDTFLADIGYEYVNSKFGAKSGSDGAKTNTAMVKVEWHL
ncbi:MAG: hypothetical protein CGU28_01670 [Candidatus Dactylopiibacterium carminicum]|uniref:Outer envelope protein n=1 Tax=Candidatus Dactylopiibacterium carminicum TaxID=857335 RepID=A0A272EUD2_9RHOO|nr:hypothetical protein [Candidatus Dactylopiibacterium carminicum]KAF7599749.1 hypothetical protein BGI27_05980 [Candidatus Dactylopiibacterium carminicum]PAS93703.1 MAG: hypothetical protein CGU29_06420 [Candidatus Dactylopiibacterium carminicum]PAS98296.1 MAG: hypothetical protein CGU28_01670 [Candidatus Dactylopiibacterium carminicum]PAS99751.1 MAG: hypothetical protein BSR46_06015 [Candidatus Dactylopiibacterium carminicum]